ncbi:30S ribosomal protein S21 [Spiroplasma platyhelix]|uniref:Small ribosomal subunit protein bS21 n=1 Tax=Spiroplasma platyhelix PALS-1 TaxID=1276218 RepID=A0A846TWA2_9MOLU|nr:30S ribosomal protein S21 [Spiroplasma platyhelix]MBE4703898.1 hypothetical protein [Spiroplasma platyhelix PALS-1]NKE38271.1 30S ribosomal protein S21 [Spiroplasma platyhelix PALS-1]UJB29156.1 hypothetical protein SPLAT_v1c03920 [Spiroplasma platyhelix PALS-1]
MPSVKLKSQRVDSNDKKANEEDFNKALKSFQKISQETKRQVKRREYYVSPRVEMRAKRNSSKKGKRRTK